MKISHSYRNPQSASSEIVQSGIETFSLAREYRTQMLRSFTVESLAFPGMCLVNLTSLQSFQAFLSSPSKFPFLPPAKFDIHNVCHFPPLPRTTQNILTKNGQGFFSKRKQKPRVKSNMRSWNVLSSSLMSGYRHRLFPNLSFHAKIWTGKGLCVPKRAMWFSATECTCVSNKTGQFASKVGPLHHFEKESAKAPRASDKRKKGETKKLRKVKISSSACKNQTSYLVFSKASKMGQIRSKNNHSY